MESIMKARVTDGAKNYGYKKKKVLGMFQPNKITLHIKLVFLDFNRPVVAGAVLQTPPLLIK